MACSVGGAGEVKQGKPSGTRVGGSSSGDDDAGVGVIGLGGEIAVATRLSATNVSRTAVDRRCARSCYA